MGTTPLRRSFFFAPMLCDVMATLSELQTDETRLKAAKAAIEENGQSMGVDGVTLTRANYRSICDELKSVQRRIARLNGKRPWIQGVNFGGLNR